MLHVTDNERFAIDALELGPMANFIYVITDKASGRLVVVDPAWEPQAILDLAKEREMPITDILLTHSHYDHINAVEPVLAAHDAQLHLLKAEAAFWGDHPARPTLHHGDDTIRFGETDIRILHTPGHTPGSACYLLDDFLIAGDTLFVWGCGRCDLDGGDPEQMYDSLRRLSQLPDTTLTLPGHDYSDRPAATIAEQKAGNPFLHCPDKAHFIDYRMRIHDKVRHDPYTAVKPGDTLDCGCATAE